MKSVIAKVAAVAALAAALLSCDNGLNGELNASSVSRAAYNSPIQVLSVRATKDGHYGISSYHRTLKIKVQNLGSDKKIVMHGEMANGAWEDIGGEWSAYYVGPAEAGWEIWQLQVSTSNYTPDGSAPRLWGDEFVVKYTVAGKTYWDNNGGANYKFGDHVGTWLAPAAGDVLVQNAYFSPYSPTFYGSISVRNLTFHKNVDIVYTLDNWATVQTAAAAYQTSDWVSYSSPIPSPNSFGIELWSYSVNFPESTDRTRIQFAVRYKPQGQAERWDNNFGQNYVWK